MSRRAVAPKPAPKPAPTGRREPKPTGTYYLFRLAIERAGAVEFCAPCYCYVLKGHTCPSWTLTLKPARQTLVRLEGGLPRRQPRDLHLDR